MAAHTLYGERWTLMPEPPVGQGLQCWENRMAEEAQLRTHMVWSELMPILEEGQESTWRSGAQAEGSLKGTRGHQHCTSPQSSMMDCDQKNESGVHVPMPGHAWPLE